MRTIRQVAGHLAPERAARDYDGEPPGEGSVRIWANLAENLTDSPNLHKGHKTSDEFRQHKWPGQPVTQAMQPQQGVDGSSGILSLPPSYLQTLVSAAYGSTISLLPPNSGEK